MSRFRFIHTADIHLDSPLLGLSTEDAVAAGQIRLATREALRTLVDEAIDREIDFLIVAGDLYDGDWQDYHTGLYFVSQMGRLDQAGIPVFLISGNHDAHNKMTRWLPLPDNVFTFDHGRPESHYLDEIDVAIHGQSYAQRDVQENLAAGYPAARESAFNVGVLHTALNGRAGHANYAPCSVQDLVSKQYDYWALGHVHTAEIVRESPHIVFCGNLQGRSVRETGAKHAYEVVVEDGIIQSMSEVYCDSVRWAVIEIPVDACESLVELPALIKQRLAAESEATGGSRLLAARIVLTGKSCLHGQIQSRRDELLNQTRAAAMALGEGVAYIEKLSLKTQPPAAQTARRQRGDAMGEFRLMLDDAPSDSDLMADIRDAVGDLLNRLPADQLESSDDPMLQAAAAGDYAALVDLAGDYLLDRLEAGQEH